MIRGQKRQQEKRWCSPKSWNSPSIGIGSFFCLFEVWGHKNSSEQLTINN
ncbi:hypothetical protein CWATWH0402_861 [Crocosphaera watsonii WH 0402]|uniref:Uncharacterized protein n=2 Tax=Crocosphaera watsonii TaxID=263511 RepID=T2JGR2_CROWT|nr:hypothetical protein CWATWH0003_B260 [Crocosphaera watsonii WH 0003]CCQ65023.1 hypothetical protein CWATWH0402_861 [Crocosphaera watsonii WH 0402]